jgi:hypothetical protein
MEIFWAAFVVLVTGWSIIDSMHIKRLYKRIEALEERLR